MKKQQNNVHIHLYWGKYQHSHDVRISKRCTRKQIYSFPKQNQHLMLTEYMLFIDVLLRSSWSGFAIFTPITEGHTCFCVVCANFWLNYKYLIVLLCFLCYSWPSQLPSCFYLRFFFPHGKKQFFAILTRRLKMPDYDQESAEASFFCLPATFSHGDTVN